MAPVADGAPGARTRNVVLAALAPGLPQVVNGRWRSGGFVMILWAALVVLIRIRWDALMGAPGAGPDARIALVAWSAGLVAAYVWSMRSTLLGKDTAGSSGSWARGVLADLLESRVVVLALWFLGLLCMAALLAPLLSTHDPMFQGSLVTERLVHPSRSHLLGTDHVGRDVFSRTLHGARLSLAIGLLATGIAVGLGSAVGAVAGYAGGWLDGVVMRVVDVVLAFPRLVLLIAVAALFHPSVSLTVLVLGLTLWPSTARLVRGEILTLKEREFAVAARALGYSHPRILVRHLLPNALAPVIVAAGLGVGDTIVLEAGLSFLGLGVQAPAPSLGSMINDGRAHLLDAWWLALSPGVVLVATVVAFNLVADALRDALDPRVRGHGVPALPGGAGLVPPERVEAPA